MQRKKPFEIEARKNGYLRHLKKLEELQNFQDPHQRSFRKQQQELQELIRKTHEVHSKSRLKEQKKRDAATALQTQRSYQNIKSIVAKEMNRKVLSIPQKHKTDNYFLQLANQRFAYKLLHAKSQFDFKHDSPEKPYRQRHTTKRYPLQEDYTDIYQKSTVAVKKKCKIHLRLKMAKINLQLHLKLIHHQSVFGSRFNALYLLQIHNEQGSKKSELLTLGSLLEAEIIFSLPVAATSIVFIEKIGLKEVVRFKLSLNEQDLREGVAWLRKPLLDLREKGVGVVEIEVKRRVKTEAQVSQIQEEQVGKWKDQLNFRESETPNFVSF